MLSDILSVCRGAIINKQCQMSGDLEVQKEARPQESKCKSSDTSEIASGGDLCEKAKGCSE